MEHPARPRTTGPGRDRKTARTGCARSPVQSDAEGPQTQTILRQFPRAVVATGSADLVSTKPQTVPGFLLPQVPRQYAHDAGTTVAVRNRPDREPTDHAVHRLRLHVPFGAAGRSVRPTGQFIKEGKETTRWRHGSKVPPRSCRRSPQRRTHHKRSRDDNDVRPRTHAAHHPRRVDCRSNFQQPT